MSSRKAAVQTVSLPRKQQQEVYNFVMLGFRASRHVYHIMHKDTGFPTLYGCWKQYHLCAPHRLTFPTHRIDAVALRHGSGDREDKLSSCLYCLYFCRFCDLQEKVFSIAAGLNAITSTAKSMNPGMVAICGISSAEWYTAQIACSLLGKPTVSIEKVLGCWAGVDLSLKV